jgi:STE24 endopeptidase
VTTRVLPSRRLAVVVILVSGAAFVGLAAVLVPWQWVPGGHLVKLRPDHVFSAGEISRAQHYSGLQRHLGWASLAVSFAVSMLLGFTPAGRALLGGLRGPWWFRVVLGCLLILAIGVVVTLPFGWRSRQVELQFGLTKQSAFGWWHDVGASFLVSWVFTAVGLVVVIGIARRLPRSWPLWAALLAALLGVLGSWVYPVVVEPLFNDFRPMPSGHLRSRIMQLAAKEHVRISDVLIADASRRTTTLNAYVSGFGSTRRVVVYDNLIHDLPEKEVEVVVAHELGHAAHQDVLTGTGLGALGAAFGVGLLGLLLSNRRLLRAARISGAGDPVAVALLLALMTIGTLAASPIENTISRAIEARADRASLAATGDYRDFVAMQKQLAVHSLSDPTPPAWSQFWFGSHPTALQRIGMADALKNANAPV